MLILESHLILLFFRFADRVRAKKMVLTHFSVRYLVPGSDLSPERLRDEAQAVAPSAQLLFATDFAEFVV